MAACSSTGTAHDSTTTSSGNASVRQGGTVTVGIDQAATGCNPNTPQGDTWANQLVLAPVLPSAFVVQSNGQPTVDQAVVEQAELVDTSPETIQYTLNPKAVWSDGTPITAADFIYAWQQQRGVSTAIAGTTPPPTDAASILGYRDIASVKGSNDQRSVTVVFKTPYADWQGLFHDLLPAHVLSDVGWDPSCSTVDPAIDLSAGPYEIGSVQPGEVVLVRNPKWWETPGYLDQIVVRTATDSAQLAHWLADGQAQVVEPTSFPQSFLEAVGALGPVKSQLEFGTTLLDLQFATDSPLLSDPRVRQALAYAIDRTRLVDATVSWADNTTVPAVTHFYTQGESGYPNLPSGVTEPFPVKAERKQTIKLLHAAGWHQGELGVWTDSDGETLSLRMAVDDGDLWARQNADLIVKQLHAVGVPVTVVSAPSAAEAGLLLAQGSVELALLPIQTTAYPTAAIAWNTLSLGTPGDNGSEDWSMLDNSHVTNGLLQAGQQLNPNSAQPLYQQADQTLWTTMSNLPLFTEPTALAWSSKMSGIGPNPYDAGLLSNSESWAYLAKPSGSSGSG